MPEPGRIRIGCSGWHYRHWRDRFYPAGLPISQWQPFYMTHFDTVELNNTFYRLPEAPVFKAWKAKAPPGFLYSLKASRYLTHMRKLRDPQQPLTLFFSRARELDTALGPVLYQLPPRLGVDLPRLRAFL